MTDAPASSFVYVTFIRATPERVWSALTDPEFTRQYWFGMHLESDWRIGATWKMVRPNGGMTDAGEILDIDPPRRLVLKWRHELRPELNAEGDARCTITLEPMEGAVKLTILHTMDQEKSKLIEAVSGGWPKILSNLKSLLETGEPVLKT